MFDFILFPVSAILWFWHTIFGAGLGPESGLAWTLAVVFLVFTLRALLIKPALSQVRAAHAARKLAPRIARLREKHGNDRQKLATEIQKLHAANGSSMFGGCLPALLQLPVFVSLYWVLRGFTPGAESNQIFDRAGVESFLNADLFGAKLGNWIDQSTAELAAFGTDRAHMIAVGVPLMVLAGAATFLTMWLSQRRHPTTDQNPQLATVTRAMTYLAPLGVLVSGWFFPVPIAVLIYLLAHNAWTLAQQHVLTNLVERAAAQEEQSHQRQRPTAPKPGQKPRRR